jgi:hypothetical protein
VIKRDDGSYLCNNGNWSEHLNKARLYEHEAYAWNAAENRKFNCESLSVLPVELTLLSIKIEGEA